MMEKDQNPLKLSREINEEKVKEDKERRECDRDGCY